MDTAPRLEVFLRRNSIPPSSGHDSRCQAANVLSPPLVRLIVQHFYYDFISEVIHAEEHLCSLKHPCKLAHRILAPVLVLKTVSLEWNDAVSSMLNGLRRALQENGSIGGEEEGFFRRIEEVYYPHVWHINTRVRRSLLFGRYRVSRTICAESGDRGVFIAYDTSAGCREPVKVVVKAWTAPMDHECVSEVRAYDTLARRSTQERAAKCGFDPVAGIAEPLASAYELSCDVYAIVLPLLGPDLSYLMSISSQVSGTDKSKGLEEKLVVAAAIQLLDRYQEIHSRGVVHNGIKPGNICLPPQPTPDISSATKAPDTLHIIDFGFSYPLVTSTAGIHVDGLQNGCEILDGGGSWRGRPIPSGQRSDVVGNRRFLSVFGHHGITQSQRDDLESLAYLLSYLRHGSLPWALTPKKPSLREKPHKVRPPSVANRVADVLDGKMDKSVPAKVTDAAATNWDAKATCAKPQLWRLKMSTPVSVLFRDMDPCFLEFWKDVKGLAFGEVPDYQGMKKRFADCWVRKGFAGRPGAVDWWEVVDELEKRI